MGRSNENGVQEARAADSRANGEMSRAARGRRGARWAWFTGVLAVVVLAAGSQFDGLAAARPRDKLIVGVLAVVFVLLGLVFVRVVAATVGRCTARVSPATVTAARLLCQLVGYVAVGTGALSLLTASVERLLLGGALTGVVVGIAAQQPLSNLIGGFILLMARPVAVGARICVHSGSLGGPFEGRIVDIGLIYTTLDTDDGNPLKIPNAGLLASALHTELRPAPRPQGADGQE